MATGFVWDERFAWHQQGIMPLGPDAEPFPGPDTPETKRRIYSLVQTSGLGRKLTQLHPRMATVAELCRLHDPSYVERVRQVSAAGGGAVGESVSIGEGGFEIAALAAGGCLVAVDAVLEGRVDNAYALVRPAGHHAEARRGRGFCVFGNIALAALHAKAAHGVARLAVIDWDVHHGNGTQAAFERDPRVQYLSTHQWPLFPGTGAKEETGVGNIVNRPLPAGTGSRVWRDVVEGDILSAMDDFAPDLVMISAGFDAHRADPLASMELVEDDFAWVTEELVALAKRHAKGRVVSVLEGGYDLAALTSSFLAHLNALRAG